MLFTSVNPATGESLNSYSTWNGERLELALGEASDAFASWSATPIARRVGLLFACATILREDKDRFAHMITLEMGKLTGEARREIEKSAGAVEFFADHGERFLAEEKESGFGRELSVHGIREFANVKSVWVN